MKTALIYFKDANLREISELFIAGGVEITTAVRLSADDDIGFRRGYDALRDTVDVLVVSAGAEFDVKEAVSSFTGVPLAENENARKRLAESGAEDYSGALMPVDSTLIPNDAGDFQGFTMEDGDFTLAVLPAGNEFTECCKKYFLPYIASKNGFADKYIFKCFGERSEITEIAESVKSEFDGGFFFTITESFCDVTLSVFFSGGGDGKQNAIRRFTEELGERIYAESDVTLSEALFTLLKLRNIKIAVAESFTGGRLAKSIINNSGASQYFCEGITAYSNDSKVKRLNVPYEDILKRGAVSAKVAYRMAAGLFSASDCDVAVATTGLAGPNGDGSGTPVGTCYIAVGTRNGIHTYGFRFAGTREEITEKGVNSALFYAVKTIKNII